MNLDTIREKIWVSIIDGTCPLKFDFLALQLFISNLRRRLQSNEVSLPEAIKDLKSFFVRHGKLPSAAKDLEKIARFGGIYV